MRYILCTLLFLIGSVGCSIAQTEHTTSICDPIKDSLELVKLYNAFNGDNWTISTNWLIPGAPVADWYGVTVNGEGCPDTIILFNNDLEGEVYDFDFPSLIVLELHFNKISGEVPDFQGMPNLTIVNFSQNSMSGSLPNFSGMPFLKELTLSGQPLIGEIPDFTNLPDLTTISLSYNALTGEIPDFSNLPKLIRLQLHNNNLSGQIPDFSNVEGLFELSLGFNQLSGQIPDLSNLPDLQTFSAQYCNLTGPITEFTNTPLLVNYVVSNNQLSGQIPDFQATPNLRRIDLSVNQLEGEIPDFSNIPNIRLIQLGNNQLSGSIPDFSSTPSLTTLDLQNNLLTGLLPDFSNLPNLELLSVSANLLEGPIPDFANIPKVENLLLHSNLFTGEIPDFSNLPLLESISLGGNQLSGSIPDFSALPSLTSFEGSSNLFTGPLTDFSMLPKLDRIYLSTNSFSGPIPDFLACPELRYIYLQNNELTGSIPTFDHLINLIGLRVSNNDLTGTIPDFSGKPELILDNNLYTFSSILESGNLNGVPFFKYHPQKLIFQDTVIQLLKGEGLVIDLMIDPALTTSTYTWQKDSLPWLPPPGNDPTSNQLLFTSLKAEDSGRYRVSISNNEAPLLILNSHTITIRVCDIIKDSLELVQLFNATDGMNWDMKTNWMVPDQPISSWYGITVNNLGCVQKIDLSNNSLSGNLPPLELYSLDTFILSENILSGSIPELQIPFVQQINLSQNVLTGEFPFVVSDWMDIQHLDFSSNGISGAIPPDLGDLCELETLRLNNNDITGELPEALTMLANLKKGQVDFSDNEIDSLKQKIIWFCPYGDTILEINPSYDRFLGICNVACTGDEWESLDDYPWIVDSLNAISCISDDCLAKKTTAGYVDARGITVFYIQQICYSQLSPEPEYLLDISLYDCAGNLLEFRTCDQNNYCAEFGALSSDEFDELKYNALWTCGEELEIMTVIEEPDDQNNYNSHQNISLICSPNPSTGYLSCNLQNISSTQTVQMVNMLGVSIPVRFQFDAETIRIDCSDAPAGIYFILVKGESGQSVARVVIE